MMTLTTTMLELFVSAHWIWLAVGLLLLALETLLPGVFLFWIGLASISAGLIFWLFPFGFAGQLMVFSALALGAILIGRRIQAMQKTQATDAPFLNDRGGALIGKIYQLETAISNGFGSVRIGDSIWRVMGMDAPEKTTVKVIGIDGSTLKVERAEKAQG
jgi:inner membrane protein